MEHEKSYPPLFITPPKNFLGEEILALSTTRHAGNMGFQNGEQVQVDDNREKFFQSLQLSWQKTIVISPLQADHLSVVNEGFLNPKIFPQLIKCDALITKTPNLILALPTADCLPIFLYDPTSSLKEKVIGLVHAGQKGIELNIIEKTILKMCRLGCHLKNIRVYLGPGLNNCCYQLPAEQFADELIAKGWQKFSVKLRDQNGNLTYYCPDLYGRIISQLQEIKRFNQKIQLTNINRGYYCTCCSGQFFSHRYSQLTKKEETRFLSIIMIKNKEKRREQK